jgi:protein-tyrosine phosphatase
MIDQPRRELRWDACYNVRDLGGLDTADGGQTRWRALIRADNLCRLTPAGCAALIDYGVRTIIDLRSPYELQLDPSPFVQAYPGITYLNLPLLDEADQAGTAAINAAQSVEDMYMLMLGRCRANIATIMTTVAEAAEGGVLIHCHAGKDRTGLVVALLLAVARVPAEVIAADYALSDTYLQPLYEQMLAELQEQVRRQQLAHLLTSAPTAMLATLAYLDTHYAGVYGYLYACGVTQQHLDCIGKRLST